MIRIRILWLILAHRNLLMCAGIARAQDYPIMNSIADKVIQKYQATSCEYLWKKKGKAKGSREQESIQLLRADPQMRRAFIDKVAPPIANKMFECGMIPRGLSDCAICPAPSLRGLGLIKRRRNP